MTSIPSISLCELAAVVGGFDEHKGKCLEAVRSALIPGAIVGALVGVVAASTARTPRRSLRILGGVTAGGAAVSGLFNIPKIAKACF
jgi:hypothetical protein